MVKLLILIALCFQLSACSFVKKIWGEAPPSRETVEIKGEALPEFTRILTGDEAESTKVLKAWRESVLDSFGQLEGGKKDFLGKDEIATLIRRGFIQFGQSPEESLSRILAVLELLGYQKGISKKNVEALFDWLKTNKGQAQTFYRLILDTSQAPSHLKSKDLVTLLDFFGSFIALTGDQVLEPAHMAELLQPFIPNTLPHAKTSLQSGIELGVSFFASFCGDRVNIKAWDGKKVGQCLHDLTAQFSDSAPVFDFMFGSVNPVLKREELQKAAALFPIKVAEWLEGHHHPLFLIKNVSVFSDSLGIPPPYAFVRLTEWIPKLNPDSTADGFSPLFLLDLSKMVQAWMFTTLKVTEKEVCTQEDWKNCAFTGTFLPADQLFSAEYATLIRMKSLGYVSKIAFYDSVAGFILEKLDTDGDGAISDKIQELINITIRLLDTNAFAQNVISRMQEKPIDPSNTEDSLKSLHRQGLSELAALAADLIPERGRNRRNLLQKLEAQVYSPETDGSYSLDRLGITSFLYVYDLVSQLRDDAILHYQLKVRNSGSLTLVKRRSIVEALPSMFNDHFPDIYSECLRWGFERTCGVLFTEILPNPSEGSDELETYEFDVVTLSAILLQSMMNRCDRNGDERLSTNIFDGNDEKHCMLSVSSVLAKRLMRSNIVKDDSKAQLLIMLVQRVPFIRWAAKTAVSNGTTHGIWWRSLPPFNWFAGPATLGSVMALMTEFMAADKVKAIEANVVGPVDAAGDELIYQNQLTNQFLPSKHRATPLAL